jgi:lipopolysaccharide assembly outer membrane protein LptD (OstA)
MKAALLLACFAFATQFAPAQNAPLKDRPRVRIQGNSTTESVSAPYAIYIAESLRRDGEVIHLKGNVELRTNGILLQAEEVDYHWRTGEISAHGDVQVVPSPTPPDIGTIRYGIK